MGSRHSTRAFIIRREMFRAHGFVENENSTIDNLDNLSSAKVDSRDRRFTLTVEFIAE